MCPQPGTAMYTAGDKAHLWLVYSLQSSEIEGYHHYLHTYVAVLNYCARRFLEIIVRHIAKYHGFVNLMSTLNIL